MIIQKVVTVSRDLTAAENELNKLIKEGWIVKSIIPQNVSVSSQYYSEKFGGFLALLEKEKE